MVVRVSREAPLVARASTVIGAPGEKIWSTLTAPDAFLRLMPATEVRVDWREGGLLAWRATLERRSYDIHGRVLRVEPHKVLAYEYENPLIRTTHRVTIALRDEDAGTRVSVEEDGHRKDRDRAHGDGAWRLVLANLKAVVEGRQEDGPDTLPGPS
jgi:uncharacterized protein YndB with AHSA1/START domain